MSLKTFQAVRLAIQEAGCRTMRESGRAGSKLVAAMERKADTRYDTHDPVGPHSHGAQRHGIGGAALPNDDAHKPELGLPLERDQSQ